MITCRKCKSTKIKSRSNYSHGTKSKSTTMLSCKNCGSTDLEQTVDRFKKRTFRK
ncbi:hypothetical protein JXM83_01355 [Candidatus Woesearchaeota archaeon]|nr:hypothetical protein [Candidatus Woesearchaeota archaeon]